MKDVMKMRGKVSALALAMALTSLVGASAQPSGGPDAKGNAPLKAAHTVNDGVAKPGANSFTQGQAREHIAKSGFSNVSGLSKGSDGVWRGHAMKDGQTVDVAMDFKGNVTTSGPMASSSAMGRTTTDSPNGEPAAPAEAMTGAATTTTTHMTTMHRSHRHHYRHHHHHNRRVSSRCAAALRAGAACSGVDRNHNGISDKEDRALSH